MKYFLAMTVMVLFSLIYSGCGGNSAFDPGIPNELDGDWNLSGKITAKDGSSETDIDQNFEIRSDRLYLEGSDETWVGSYYYPNLHIRFNMIVQDEDVVGCGNVKTTAKVTVVTFIVDSDESDFDGYAIGFYETDSDCDGITRVELNGSLALKRT
jgi:hypothetical protein